MYKIIFEDNTIFNGGHPGDSKWNDMPNKKIKKLEYNIGKYIIVLENFEAYNHIIEYSYTLSKNNSNIIRILIIGKFDKIFYSIIIDIKNKKIFLKKSRQIEKYTGWKMGEKGIKPIIKKEIINV